MAKTSIEWTDRSANPIRARNKMTGKIGWHCTKVSSGCSRCYSESLNRRLGTGLSFAKRSTEEVEIFFDPRPMDAILRLRKKGQRVFLADMTDLFGEFVPDDYIDRVFAYMALAHDQTFQVLTKRPERALRWVDRAFATRPSIGCIVISRDGDRVAIEPGEDRGWPLDNVWLGTSVENQDQAEKRVPMLLRVPAAVRFLSCEPLLGGVDLTGSLGCFHSSDDPNQDDHSLCAPTLDWVIVGGESGPHARPCNIAWIRSIRDQCQSAGVAVFVKQVGSVPTDGNCLLSIADPKGGDMEEWAADLRVREFPRVGMEVAR